MYVNLVSIFLALIIGVHGESWKHVLFRKIWGVTPNWTPTTTRINTIFVRRTPAPTPTPTPPPTPGSPLAPDPGTAPVAPGLWTNVGILWAPPSTVEVVVNGRRLDKFVIEDRPGQKLLRISTLANNIGIKIILDRNWLNQQRKINCPENKFRKEAKGMVEDEFPRESEGSSYERSATDVNFDDIIHTAPEDFWAGIDVGDDPLEYSTSTNLYGNDSCQPVGFNMFVEGASYWNTESETRNSRWWCADRSYLGWKRWCNSPHPLPPANSVWYKAYGIEPGWKSIKLLDDKTRKQLFRQAETIWAWPSKFNKTTSFTPPRVRGERRDIDLRRDALPQTVICCVKKPQTPSPRVRVAHVQLPSNRQQAAPGGRSAHLPTPPPVRPTTPPVPAWRVMLHRRNPPPPGGVPGNQPGQGTRPTAAPPTGSPG